MAKKNKKQTKSEYYSAGTNAIIAAAKGGATKNEIKQMVIAHNKGTIGSNRKGKGNAKISPKLMWSYMPKPKAETKVEKAKTEKPVVAPPTLQESRDTFYNEDDFRESGQEGWFEGIKRPSEERKAVISEARKSGYMRDLQGAVETKYGKPLHEISDPVDRQMAGDAMIDKDGNILPMSSASGQYSGDTGSGFPKKAPRGFKMPGWGKKK